ncbi:MAG: hypothetical protein KAX09_08580 [Candidatus Heimdallarchaeota archaeon]|nr:hypothetical protein [Candidatus Heimdallarchaeota archaeon]MCK4291023.1 hypothetical protein [Candidatus Heimdallarchaeota archaeon]
MNDEQCIKQIVSNISSLKDIDVNNTPPYNVLTSMKTIHRNLELLKIDVSKIDLIDKFESELIDLRVRLSKLQIYYSDKSEEYKNRILNILDTHLAKFEKIRELKRQMDGLEKQDTEISLAEKQMILLGIQKE